LGVALSPARGQVLVHPLGPLGQNLISVVRGHGHDSEDLVDELEGHVLMKEVAQGIHENPTWPGPAQRLIEAHIMDSHVLERAPEVDGLR